MTPQSFVIRRGDLTRFDNVVRALEVLLTQQDTEVSFKRYVEERSDAQHNGFWYWCRYAARQFRDAGQPCSEEWIHDYVLGQVFGWKNDPWGNKRPARTLTKPRRPTDEEMSEIMTRFPVEMSEFGIVLPELDPMKRSRS